MTNGEQQAALEELRHETTDRPRSDSWLARGIGVLVVFSLVVLLALGYLAISTHSEVQATRTLLTNGKTSSAVSAKKTETITEEIRTLIETGRTTGAQASKAAAALSALSVTRSTQTRAIICSIAASVHDTAAVVAKYCPKGTP